MIRASLFGFRSGRSQVMGIMYIVATFDPEMSSDVS